MIGLIFLLWMICHCAHTPSTARSGTYRTMFFTFPKHWHQLCRLILACVLFFFNFFYFCLFFFFIVFFFFFCFFFFFFFFWLVFFSLVVVIRVIIPVIPRGAYALTVGAFIGELASIEILVAIRPIAPLILPWFQLPMQATRCLQL